MEKIGKKLVKQVNRDVKLISKYKDDPALVERFIKFEYCWITCVSHKVKPGVSGLSMYNHYNRVDLRKALSKFFENKLVEEGIKSAKKPNVAG